ncbi:MAG TPA: DUF3750 domain-containing protein [Steroidobacteraceae bacterium]|jgi:hypothetical protein|nr:DUF3750 domain-containing protein [Steroidobacteraceae bacterium]
MFILFSCLYLLPVLLSAAIYYFTGRSANWRAADRSSAQLLAPPEKMPSAVVRVFSARTVSWRGIIATHSWIVIKEEGAPKYERFDYTAWGLPIWKDRFVPDGRWFGSIPEVIFAAEGAAAARMIPKIRTFIRHYRYSRPGDYRIWPGPNSNTFVAAIMQAVPGLRACLPPTAIGKDFPYDGRWFDLTPSKTGFRINLGGYAGITLGWYEGLELNLLGAVAGLDIRRPALKLAGLGRIGIPANAHAGA